MEDKLNFTNDELIELKEKLESDDIDDAEEILYDIIEKMPALIDEVLEYRERMN